MKDYRDVRARTSFLDLCKTPSLAAEVTVTAAERLGVDAAIIFADILLILEPLGLQLEFAKDEGPVINNPIRTAADVKALHELEDVNTLDAAYAAVHRDHPFQAPPALAGAIRALLQQPGAESILDGARAPGSEETHERA